MQSLSDRFDLPSMLGDEAPRLAIEPVNRSIPSATPALRRAEAAGLHEKFEQPLSLDKIRGGASSVVQKRVTSLIPRIGGSPGQQDDNQLSNLLHVSRVRQPPTVTATVGKNLQPVDRKAEVERGYAVA